MVEISASLLSGCFARLGEDIKNLSFAGVHRFHWDFMDGSYVPTLSFGPCVMASVRSMTPLPFDVHLMVREVDGLIPACIEGGADTLCFHPEVLFHPYRTIQNIQRLGKKAGIALNPGTSLSVVETLLPLVDFVLVMTVNPGFGGQAFLSDQLKKIKEIQEWAHQKKRDLPIHVDGGICPKTAPLVQEAGATVLISGSSLFSDTASYEQKISLLQSSCPREGL